MSETPNPRVSPTDALTHARVEYESLLVENALRIAQGHETTAEEGTAIGAAWSALLAAYRLALAEQLRQEAPRYGPPGVFGSSLRAAAKLIEREGV